MATVEVCERCRRVIAVRGEEGEAVEDLRVAPGDHVVLTELCEECRRKQKETTERFRRGNRTTFEE